MQRKLSLIVSLLAALLAVFVGAATMPSLSSAAATSQQPTTINVADGEVVIVANGICSFLEAFENAARSTFGNGPHGDCALGTAGVEDIVSLAPNGIYVFPAFYGNIGNGNDPFIIEGNNAVLDHADRSFFNVRFGQSMTVRNLTMQGSSGSANSAVAVLGGTLTLDGVTMKDNERGSALRAYEFGGATSTLNVLNSTFENNNGASGGAIRIENAGVVARIENSTFIGNGAATDDGLATQFGGAVRVFDGAELTLVNSHFEDNEASVEGGGLDVSGGATAIISNTTFSNNSVISETAAGGGLAIVTSTVTMQGSVVTGNTAQSASTKTRAGGIYIRNSTLDIINSTVSGNTGDKIGGIYASGSSSIVTLDFMTIVANASLDGAFAGGIHTDDGAFNFIKSSIVVGNTAPGASNDDCSEDSGNFDSLGYNIRKTAGSSGCDFTDTGDTAFPSALADHLDPTLALNGGSTLNHALTAMSFAKNRVPLGTHSCSAGAVDQRGFLRSNGDGVKCDAGAFEVGAESTPTSVTLASGAAQAQAEAMSGLAIGLIVVGLCSGVVLRRKLS